MLGQFLHAFSLNELVDISEAHRAELSRIRGISPVRRNTFSNANRTGDPVVAERFYWALRDRFGSSAPGFRNVSNRGSLARFKTRHIYAVDSSLIPLSLNCIDWAKCIHRKSTAKLHMRTNVANMLPDFVVIDSAQKTDIRKADEMCADLQDGDVVITDRGCYSFGFYHGLKERNITFVGRVRHCLKHALVAAVPEGERQSGIVSDERILLAERYTKRKYASEVRLVIADLYRSRWTVELLFKELKQTLQLQSFYGTNAVKWQIWAALIVHQILRYQSHLSKWRGSYSRFIGIVRTAIWMKMDLARLLRFYGTAPPVISKARAGNIPYLPGFEKSYLKAMGQQTA